jgi:type IV secretory pathway VirB2 component (pilin)
MSKSCGLAVCLLTMLLLGARAETNALSATGFSADGLYNLANAYDRAGQPGLAILNYERAGLLAPNDPDIAANLSAVRAASGLPAERAAWFERAATFLAPAVAAWVAVLGLLILGVSVLWGLRTARRPWLRRAGLLIGVLLVASTVANGLVLWPRLQRAIVLVAGTPVRATPALLGEPLFTLPEGAAVRLLGEHQDFVLVQIKPGTRGWIARASIATVLP